MMEILVHSLSITIFVFITMIIVDYINVLTRGKFSSLIRGGRIRQYTVASFLGATPGCLGSFLNVSFYVRGLLSFGAISGAMIATSGDEAFVMLAVFPGKALLLFILLFLLGIITGFLIDWVAGPLGIIPCQECRFAPLHLDDEQCRCFDLSFWSNPTRIQFIRFFLIFLLVGVIYLLIRGGGPSGWMRVTLFFLLSFGLFLSLTVPDHYLKKHVWEHIIKEHIWRVFIWTLGALIFVHFGLEFFNLEQFIKSNLGLVIILSGIVGVIPESGPHLVFVMMYKEGIIPFSVLLTSSIVQDGHGLLPLLSYSVRDSLLIKLFNLVLGLVIGALCYISGL
ncbi:selenocysteine protein [candidate division WOR-3 bacterium]|uniref:Selenocysteine protein n=1 Tax=candidate division WOR-3 bacterium TaxID=2052148 RepID=A0A660SFA4_UNCW3|nr:MAG: selenocysteine protein [candidate division WOR-3 bacterium]